MKNDTKKETNAYPELSSYRYHGKLVDEVTLNFGNETITLEKDVEFVILIVKKD